MQVACLSLGPGAPKSSQLGLLRCGCEATFSLLCKTRKRRKNAGFWPFLVLLGLWSPPPLNPEGFGNQVIFHRKQENTVKMQSKSLFLELGFPKKQQPNFLKIGFQAFAHFVKINKNTVKMQVFSASARNRLGAKSPPTPFLPEASLNFSTLELFHKNMCFSRASKKTP